jgi:exosome complex exonuclease DIS3/RRP44
MSPADYFHYGLASPVYTHFTSPIRRYADIVVHRLLASSMGLTPLPTAIQDKTRVHEMAETINHRHRMAQLVSRASSELFTLIFFKDKRIEEDALIVSVKQNGIRVIVPRYGIEHGITLWKEDIEKESKNPWIYDETTLSLSGPNNVRYRVFEQIRVLIYVSESLNRRRWLTIELIDKLKMSEPNQNLLTHKNNLQDCSMNDTNEEIVSKCIRVRSPTENKKNKKQKQAK